MDNYVLNSENKELVKNKLNEIIDIGIDFKCQEVFAEKSTTNLQFKDLADIPLQGKSIDQVVKEFKDKILPYCSNFSTKNFMGFPDSGDSIAGIGGAIMCDLLQQNLINSSFCAPIATYIEIAVITWFRNILGYKVDKINNIFDVGGIITYGGTCSNATAMLLARENHLVAMSDGVKDPSKYKIIVPKGIAHYSIKSSSMWIGCGDNIIEVPTKNFKYDLKELKKALKKYKGEIMSVVAYVGDSRTMSIENLKDVYEIVKKEDKNIWLHADACHGFSLAFSEKLKSKIQGLELFDSISIDPHKVMMIPYTLSSLLVKDPEKMKLISSTSDLIMQEPFAFGQITPFIGSKSWISLKAWFVMKNMGVKKIGKIIERRCEMANYLGNLIDESNDFILINDININSVLFMYVGNKSKVEYSLDKLNNLNKRIKSVIDEEKIYYIHQFSIKDDLGKIKKDSLLYPLRYMSGNDKLLKKDINKLLQYIRKIAENIILQGGDI